MSALTAAAQSIAAFVVHAGLQVPLLAAAAWCAVRLGRPQARVAYRVWVGTLLLCVLLPVASTIVARRAAIERARFAANITYDSSFGLPDLPAMQRQPEWKRLLHQHVTSRGLDPFAFALTGAWARVIASVWLAAFAFFLLQLAVAWWRVRRLLSSVSAEPVPGAILASLSKRCAQWDLAVPDAKLHESLGGPVLAGVFRPVLLLPAATVNSMTAAEIDAILAHELAHLRRRDPLVHAMCSMVLLPVGFHPAVFWVSRHVRQTREMACDAEAAQTMGSAQEYAWALLQVAERINTKQTHGLSLGMFGNGLLGMALQLFINRGAMEERMQMLVNGNGTEVRGRAVRIAAGVSLATGAVLAATMLQVQPTLAAERPVMQAPQAAVPQTTPAAVVSSEPQEEGPQLIGGAHAREQLRHAKRQLAEAERTATSEHDRQLIETTRGMLSAAESALRSADGSDEHTAGLDRLSTLKLQLDGLKSIDTSAFREQMEQQRAAMAAMQVQLNSPEWKAQMESARKAMEAAHAQMNTPEFKAQMEQARRIDKKQIDAMLAQAREQQQRAMEQLRSGAFKAQMDEAARLMARNEMPPVPAYPLAPEASQNADKPARVSSGVMAGNKLGGDNPTYPADAKEKHVSGTVVLHAIIDKAGKVESVQVVSSPDDSLSKSAVAAVQTWTYKPYLLNGDPTAVDTTINVNFSLMQ